MATYLLSAFLLLFGLMNLVTTEIPKWVLGVLAVLAGVAMLISRAFPVNPKLK